MLRSFIAVSFVPESTVTGLMDSIGPLKGSKVPHHEVVHLTLAFLGDITDNEKELICGIIRSIKFSRFSVKTTHVGAFPNLARARVAFIGVMSPELLELQKRLMSLLPWKFREKREFVPHLTVSRFKVPTDIRGLVRETEGRFYGEYRIERLSLFRSDLTPDGAVYTEICSVQLM